MKRRIYPTDLAFPKRDPMKGPQLVVPDLNQTINLVDDLVGLDKDEAIDAAENLHTQFVDMQNFIIKMMDWADKADHRAEDFRDWHDSARDRMDKTIIEIFKLRHVELTKTCKHKMTTYTMDGNEVHACLCCDHAYSDDLPDIHSAKIVREEVTRRTIARKLKREQS